MLAKASKLVADGLSKTAEPDSYQLAHEWLKTMTQRENGLPPGAKSHPIVWIQWGVSKLPRSERDALLNAFDSWHSVSVLGGKIPFVQSRPIEARATWTGAKFKLPDGSSGHGISAYKFLTAPFGPAIWQREWRVRFYDAVTPKGSAQGFTDLGAVRGRGITWAIESALLRLSVEQKGIICNDADPTALKRFTAVGLWRLDVENLIQRPKYGVPPCAPTTLKAVVSSLVESHRGRPKGT